MKTKRMTAAVLTVILALACFTSCSADITSGSKEIKYRVKDGCAAVTQLPSATGITEIIIADEYEGVPVTEITDFAGSNLEFAEKITIGKNVKTIGEWAFSNNQKLKEFVVAEGNENFRAVDGVLFTADMKTLLYYPAAGNEEYTIPDTVTEIRTKAFYKCSALKSLIIPDTVKTIGEKAFFRCSELTGLTLPQALETIEKDAFGYCTALTELTIPETIGTIGEYAFYNCTSLMKITVNAKEDDIALGKNWQPTNNGLAIDELNISFAE